MRQAGRYLPEYRDVRAEATLLEICHDPDLATEITLQPVLRFPIDAAIIFADILLPFEPLGLGLSFQTGEGPVIAKPVRTEQDIANLPAIDVEADLAHVLAALRSVRAALDARIALIGFAGAPFTLASYAIEGGSSRNFVRTKQFMYSQPDLWEALLQHFAEIVGRYLAAQVRAGADVVQLFDSWVGALSPDDYRTYVLPYSKRALELAGQAGAPTIHFGTGTATLLGDLAAAGGDVIGVDWRIPLDDGWSHFEERGIQGNLDPTALFAHPEEIERRVHHILRRAAGRPGHIFNLGHGVLPNTPIEGVEAMIGAVKRWDEATAG
jgi:uroporphyrinogen decarboxylase